MSSSVRFTPVLHNITSDRVVFCYRENDDDSLEIAQYYKTVRNLPETHLISLACSDSDFITESEYLETIENPISEAITQLQSSSSSNQREIWVIILGYNVPIGFYGSDPYDPYDPYFTETIAIASRLHRLGFEREDKFANYTYNRKRFKFFDQDDSNGLYLTAVLNGPSKQSVINLIDRAIKTQNQAYITGNLYVDPYGKKSTEIQLDYQSDILDFVNNESNNLGLTVKTTNSTRLNIDPTVNSLQNDSFYWGWFTDRYSEKLFGDQNDTRVFLYNADSDSARYIKSELDNDISNPWCNLAIGINPGYATCAGSIDDPGEENYLRPRPFFEALHQGATIAEAFLFSSPVADWKIILIGDPMMSVSFSLGLPAEQDINNATIPNHEAILRTKNLIEDGLGLGIRQARLADDIVNRVYLSNNLQEESALLIPTNDWRDLKNTSAQYSLFTPVVDSLLSYIRRTEGLSFSQWLINQNQKTTILLNDLLEAGVPQGGVNESSLYPQGYWQYSFQYIHNRQILENIYFQLQLSLDSDFSNLAIDLNSLSNNDGWKYEKEPYVYYSMPNNGFASNYSGRHILFESQIEHYLNRTELYYVRWRALDNYGDAILDWQVDSTQLIIKT